MTDAVYCLECAVQSYDWGKLGNESKVAHFASKFTDINNDKPYAELWMGTHPNGPSKITGTNTFLKEAISSNPTQHLTAAIAQNYDNDLPFLFKVLSVRKALSIQAHPDKKLGKELHEKYPTIYKDPNHKPEMAIAITDFEALFGFRPLNEVASCLHEFPEFAALVGDATVKKFLDSVRGQSETTSPEEITSNKAVLRELFAAVMMADANVVKESVDKMSRRVEREQRETGDDDCTKELIVRLSTQYPGDVGVFAVLMLNYVKLNPGQAIFLGANEPHAYLFGDCVECMAASDNVVRAGLTPKFKDVPVLVNMLTYNYGPADKQILSPIRHSSTTVLYDPPIEEFSVLLTTLTRENASEEFDPISGPSVLIVTEGTGVMIVDNQERKKELWPGGVYFIGAGIKIRIDTKDGLVAYRALCTV
ncbi:10710_t:CDS:2 [Paraglomus occultum]|uniref:Mannose-6-phosphate isomerase n=1 Tax=Paraglomus occultum TaxID=144539 RepID=A0A9N9F3V2_9GLOM|nr:10710_t:CDS:2 [Paraglomus occultum]